MGSATYRNMTNLAEGIYTYYWFAKDYAGQANQTETRTVKVDYTKPLTTDDSDSSWHSDNVTITLACSDALSGCSYTKYCIYDNGTSPCNPESGSVGNSVNVGCASGNVCRKIVRYYSVDNAQNKEDVKESSVILIDKEQPSFSQISIDPSYENYTDGLGYNISARPSDGGSGINISSCEYTTDNATWNAASWNGSFCYANNLACSDGEMLTIAFRISDNIGNQNTSHYASVVCDAENPVITEVYPSANSCTNDTTPTLNATAADTVSGINATGYEWTPYINGTPQPTVIGGNEYTFPPIGEQVVVWAYVRSRDNIGHLSDANRTANLTVDTKGASAPPLTSPVQWHNSSDNTPFFEWGEPSYKSCTGIISGYRIEITADSSCSSPVQSSITTDMNYTASQLSDGIYYWHVRAIDSRGVEGEWSECRKIVIDTQPPDSPSLLTPQNNMCNLTTLTFAWNNANDNGPSGTEKYYIEIDNDTDFSSPVAAAWTYSTSYTQVLENHKTYYWRVLAADFAQNNGSYSAAWSVTTGDSQCIGYSPLTCPSSDYICNATCYHVERDAAESYCTDSTGCTPFTWLSYADVSYSDIKCCGDDGSESFEQYEGAGRSCCYMGSSLGSDENSGNILCYDGLLYSCGGQMFRSASKGDVYGTKYCNGTDWINATKMPAGTDPRLGGVGANITIWADYMTLKDEDVKQASVLITITETSGVGVSDVSSSMKYNSSSGRYEYAYYISRKGSYKYTIRAEKAGYQPQTAISRFGAIGTFNIKIVTSSDNLKVSVEDVDNAVNMTTMPPNSVIIYNDTKYVSFEDENSIFGMVSETETNAIFNKTSFGGILSIEKKFAHSRTLVPITKGDYRIIDRRLPFLETGEFFQKITPTFGFGFGSEYPIKVLLENRLNLTSDRGKIIFKRGFHQIELTTEEEMDVEDEEEKSISIKKPDESEDNINSPDTPSYPRVPPK